MKSPFMDARRDPGQKGSAVLMVVVMISLLAMIPVSLQITNLSNEKSKINHTFYAQANNVARGGVEDALMWFNRQGLQPVRSNGVGIYAHPDQAFFPRTSTNPLNDDTLDESIGLVKEYPLNSDGSLWAHYEVRRQSADWSVNPAAYDSRAVHDVSHLRVNGAAQGDGLAWSLECTGLVYRPQFPLKAISSGQSILQFPGQQVAKSNVTSEFVKISMNVPAAAALLIRDYNNIVQTPALGPLYSSFRGVNRYGVAFENNAPGLLPNYITGDPAGTIQIAPGSFPTIQNIVGISTAQLRHLTDLNVKSVSEIPSNSYPSMAMVYIDGNAAFTNAVPLNGGGLLYVNGDMSITGIGSRFSGLIYVEGNLSVTSPFTFTGTLIVNGTLTIDNSVDYSTFKYDEETLYLVRQQLAQYRENRSSYFVYSPLQI